MIGHSSSKLFCFKGTEKGKLGILYEKRDYLHLPLVATAAASINRKGLLHSKES